MRDAFIRALVDLARVDRDVILVTGDLGFGVLDEFRREFPAQFINAGVAEQNMTGMAAGLALEGKKVFIYSIANFPTLRCLEQIRNDVLYHNAPVNTVAIGGGFSYGSLGMSHHATEDVAIMRALAGMRVYAPCADIEAEAIAQHLVANPGPSYLRLDKSKVADSHGADFIHGKIRQLSFGSDVAILGYGGVLQEALSAADLLHAKGLECSVFSVHTLKPFDAVMLIDIARRYRVLVTIEEHVGVGGLGSIVADVLIETDVVRGKLCRISLPDVYSSIVGSQEYLRERHNLDAKSVACRISEVIAAGVIC